MKTGDTVWVYPHGSPKEASEAKVEIISGNGVSLALRLREKPPWVRVLDGVLIHKEIGEICMLLMRERVGPWVEITNGGHYEVEESKP